MTAPIDPERTLALSYAPPLHAAALAALFAVDDTLGRIVRAARDPLVGQMRLTWWFDALAALDGAPPPPQPVLRAVAAEIVARGIGGDAVAQLVDGWEVLLEDAIDNAALVRYAQGRGGRLFALAGRLLGGDAGDTLAPAGEGWALADLARHVRDPAVAARARTLAQARLGPALAHPWRRDLRALGALAHLARMDLDRSNDAPSSAGSPRRVARLAWHRLTGR